MEIGLVERFYLIQADKLSSKDVSVPYLVRLSRRLDPAFENIH